MGEGLYLLVMAILLWKCLFSGQGFHLGTALCAFYFLSRGSRLSKLVECQRPSDGQERVSALGLDRPRPKSFLLPNQLWHLGKLLSPFLERMIMKTTSLGCWGRAECDNAAIRLAHSVYEMADITRIE